MGRLLEEMNRLSIRTKIQTLANGKERGGVPYGKGALAHLLKNRCYVGEISHLGAVHAAEHEPIVDRQTFDAVQASLAANAIVRKAKSKASDYLLTGLIFDSAGNRMTPSHSRKKGVRYRYYVSQAILQSRKDRAGQVFRVPAPHIEDVIERFVRDRCRHLQGEIRPLIEAQVQRITVQTDSISVGLSGSDGDPAVTGTQSRQIVSLPWSKKPFRAEKGITRELGAAKEPAVIGAEAAIGAVARARRWVDELMAGNSLAEIARRESKGERQIRLLIPLAFVPPRQLSEYIGSKTQSVNVTTLAKSVPALWPNAGAH